MWIMCCITYVGYAQFDSIRVIYVRPESCGLGSVYLENSHSGNYFYNWNDGGTGSIRNDLKAGKYLLNIVDGASGADTTLTFEIQKTWCKVTIPITFSPNNDGINDSFSVNGASLYPNFLLQIFNRWGQIVYEQQKEPKPWDGTSHGFKLPDDAYYYVFFYDQDKKDAYESGSVTIMR